MNKYTVGHGQAWGPRGEVCEGHIPPNGAVASVALGPITVGQGDARVGPALASEQALCRSCQQHSESTIIGVTFRACLCFWELSVLPV